MLKKILVLCLVCNACMAYTATTSQAAVSNNNNNIGTISAFLKEILKITGIVTANNASILQNATVHVATIFSNVLPPLPPGLPPLNLDEVILSVFKWFQDILIWYATVIKKLEDSLKLPSLQSLPNVPGNFTIDETGKSITDWATVNQKSIQAAIDEALKGVEPFPPYPDIFPKIAKQYVDYLQVIPDSIREVIKNTVKSIGEEINKMVQDMIKDAVKAAIPQALNIPKIQLFPNNTLPKLFGF